jgi:hypothetical protein
MVQQIKSLGQELQALWGWRFGWTLACKLIAPGQEVGRRFPGCALFKRFLRAGPPGQTTNQLAASRRAGPDFAFGVRTKKQGEPRLTRYGLRCKRQDQCHKKKKDAPHVNR